MPRDWGIHAAILDVVPCAGKRVRAGARGDMRRGRRLSEERVEDFVDWVTRGNVSQVKTVLASIVLALAVYQVLLMAVGYGKLRVSFLKPKAAAFTHRAVGDAAVAVGIFVAFLCWSYFGVGDGIEHARGEETTRATIHVVAGSSFVVVVVAKVIVVRWVRRFDRYIPAIGITLFALFSIAWLTSAANYLWET